jgi:predicted nucleic acid-binding protein
MSDGPILTFVDSCVLIAAARGNDSVTDNALAILSDSNRSFASSMFVRLEVLPGPAFHRDEDEFNFHMEFFNRVTRWATCDDALLEQAFHEAQNAGVLNAMDALHVAAAAQLGCNELITAEKPDKPICRASLVKVTSIR